MGSQKVSLGDVESVSYRAEGLLHLTDWGLILEWSKTRTTQRVTMMGEVGTNVDELPPEVVEMRIEDIAGASMIGGWWWRRPQIELRARGLEVFRGIPGSRGATIRFPIERRDRSLARAFAIEINELSAAAELRPPDERGRFEAGTTDPGTDPGTTNS